MDRKLEETLTKAYESLAVMEPGTEEFRDLSRAISDLERAYTERRRYELANDEHYSKMIDMARQANEEKKRTVVDGVLGVGKLVVTGALVLFTLKFEETGSVRSSAMKFIPKL